MAPTEITMDASFEIFTGSIRPNGHTGSPVEVLNAQEVLGVSILTPDLEAVAYGYRAKALRQFVRDRFRRHQAKRNRRPATSK